MTTILIWLGSGFAFAVGVFVGAMLMSYLKGKPSVDDATKQSVAELKRRNDIGYEEAQHLKVIAKGVFQIADEIRKGKT